MFKFFIFIFPLSLLIAVPFARGQSCCAPGSSPYGSMEQGTLPERQLQVGLFYEYYSGQRAFEGTQEVPDLQDRKSTSQIASLAVSYGLSPRISGSVVIPFHSRERRQKAFEENGKVHQFFFSGKGLGDLAILGKWSLIPFNFISRREVTLGVGLKFPTGPHEQERDGVRVPIDLQPGSGTFDGLAQVYLLQSYQKMDFVGSAVFRYTGTDENDYRFGNEFLYLAGLQYPLTDRWRVSSQIKGRVVGSDIFEDETVQSTGSHRIHLFPGIRFYPTAALSLQASLLYPIYQWVKGNQLATDYNVSLSSNYSLYF
ncbi:hypothetical protein IIA15_03820 [candidate division TA06 bacterium]|nr:hypothetical protein [candidate division TA06 bacterium]